jgi:UDP-glucose 4-epimerase
VREVLDSVERISGQKVVVREEPRRAGDPPSLVAKCDRVRDLLKWTPRHNQLDTIVRTSLEWEKRLKAEPWTSGS